MMKNTKKKFIHFFSSQGMSLLEVLIAVAILGFMSVAIVSNTRSSFNIKDRVTKTNKDRLRIYTAFNIIENDFSQIYSPLFFSKKFDMEKLAVQIKDRSDPLYILKEKLTASINEQFRGNALFYVPSEDGLPVPRFKQPDKSTFEFFTNSHRRVIENSHESTYAWVVYTLEDHTEEDVEYWKENFGEEISDKLKSNLVRYFIPLNPFSNEDIDFDKVKGQVIMENVKELEFSFWDSDKEKFLKLDSTLEGKGWIQSMKVKVVYLNMDGVEEEIEKIFRHLWPLYNPIENKVESGSVSNNTTGLPQ